MIEDCPTFVDLIMQLGPEDAENYVLEQTYHGAGVPSPEAEDDENGRN